jgi:hypothetical protein
VYAAEHGLRVDAGEQRGLPGAALGQTGHAEGGVERHQDETVGTLHPLESQRPAEQGPQRRRRHRHERVARLLRPQPDAVDEEQQQAMVGCAHRRQG